MVKKAENIIVGISIGDLNGIGSEVILKTFEDIRMLELCTPVIFANVKIISFLKKEFKLTAAIHGIDKIEQLVVGKINVLNVWREGVNLEFGKNDDVVGSYAIKSFVAATNALKEGFVDVLVTAPINKYNIQSEEFKFPGHTDYLNQELNGDGYNDYWNIRLPVEYQGKISIYDRYGKLIKQIRSEEEGWDGTYNGNLLPSTDYWFKVNYIENNQQKEFKSHFSLKR